MELGEIKSIYRIFDDAVTKSIDENTGLFLILHQVIF